MSKAKIISSVVRKVWKAVGGKGKITTTDRLTGRTRPLSSRQQHLANKGKKQTTALPTRHRRANPSNMAWQPQSGSLGRAPGGPLGRPMKQNLGTGGHERMHTKWKARGTAAVTAERRSVRLGRRIPAGGTQPRGTININPLVAKVNAMKSVSKKQAHGPARNFSMLGPKSLQHQKAYEKMQQENIKHLTRGAKAAALYTTAYLGYKTGRNRGR